MKRLGLVALMVLMVVGSARAALEGGMREVGVAVSFQEIAADVDGVEQDGMYNMTGQFVLNYFMASHWSFGMDVRLSVFATKGADDKLDPSGTAFAMGRTDLYLGGAEWAVIPYIGGHGGYSFSAFSGYSSEEDVEWESQIAYGGQGGFKIFASEHVSWNIEGDLTIFESGESSSEDDMAAMGVEMPEIKYQVTTLLIGFSYYF